MAADGLVSAFRVPADYGVLAFVRGAVACILERSGWPLDGIGRVLLAANEGVTNAIEHGSPAGAPVTVELRLTDQELELRIVDQGRPGVPVPTCAAAPPPPDNPRGRGLIIMRALADDFAVEGRGSGTEVALRFARAEAPAEDRRRHLRAA